MSPVVVVAISVALMSVVLSAIVNVKVKFAPDARTAYWGLFGLAVDLTSAVSSVVVVAFLVRDFSSTEPPTRRTVVLDSLSVGVLVLQAAVVVFRVTVPAMWRAILRSLETQQVLMDVSRKHLDITSKLHNVVEETRRGADGPKTGGSD